MYNVKVMHYVNGERQTRIYSSMIFDGSLSDKEIARRKLANNQYTIKNPFDDQLCMEVSSFEEALQLEEIKKARSINNSKKRTINHIYEISRSNIWEWFVTLTFSPDKVDRYDYPSCVSKLSKWLNNCRRTCGNNFKYIVVPELHKDGAYHFHGLFIGAESLNFSYSGHKTKTGQDIYNIGKYRLGWTTATRVANTSAVSKYITKYTTKELVVATKGRKRYWCSKNCDRPLVETFVLDRADCNTLHSDLLANCQAYKHVEYQVENNTYSVDYIENKRSIEP